MQERWRCDAGAVLGAAKKAIPQDHCPEQVKRAMLVDELEFA